MRGKGSGPVRLAHPSCPRCAPLPPPPLALPPTPTRASYATKTRTKEYDQEAMRYLSYVLYPLVIGYAIYSLMYKSHKSW